MKEVKKILICGGGMMGSAIAQVLAGLDDVTITVYDKFPVDIEAKIRNNFYQWNKKARIPEMCTYKSFFMFAFCRNFCRAHNGCIKRP